MLNLSKQLINKIDALQPREKLLTMLAVVAVIYFMVHALLLVPEQVRQKAISRKIELQQVEINALDKAAGLMSSGVTLEQEKSVIDGFEKTIAGAGVLLGTADTTSPELGSLLKTLLANHPGLTLVSLKTLPVTTVVVANAATEHKEPGVPSGVVPAIYRHGVEVSIRGNYLALLPYLEALQRYPKRLFWHEAKLDVANYPEAVLNVTIYTLSDQPNLLLG